MSEVFYRISNNRIGADDEKIMELFADGILVPVEINLEAAAKGYGLGYQETADILSLALGFEVTFGGDE
jgi:hypothetical protein